MTNEWPAISEEIEAAISAQAEPISIECPTCHQGSVETETLGIWTSNERVPVADVHQAVKRANEKKWVKGWLGDWFLWLREWDEESSFRLKPPVDRMRAFNAQRMREEAAQMLENADALNARGDES